MYRSDVKSGTDKRLSDTQKIRTIDLHIHSVHSDGTDTVPDLLRGISDSGIDLFSLTDHDTTDGCREMIKYLDDTSPLFTPEVEFSCQSGDERCHILGYAYRLCDSPVVRCAEKRREIRIYKTESRLRHLRLKYGFEPTEEEMEHLMSLPCPGKPHIAQLMVTHGYAESVSEAIDRYISDCEDIECPLSPEDAIGAILSSGGIPVLAHGILGDGRSLLTEEQLSSRVRRLVGAGLMGMECFYSGYTAEFEEASLRTAKKYSVMPTAGSDYHGNIKNIAIASVSCRRNEEVRNYLEPIISKIISGLKTDRPAEHH